MNAPSRIRTQRFDTADAEILLAIAHAATPSGKHVRTPDRETVALVEQFFAPYGERALHIYTGLLRALDLASIPLSGARLSTLPTSEREVTLLRLADATATHFLVRAATVPIKLAQVIHPQVPEKIGARVGHGLSVLATESPRWAERIVDARVLASDETLEVDVVIVGSGAGGAPVANALASRGHAVLVLEEGGHYDRRDFQGASWRRGLTMQRQHAVLGNTVIGLPTGMTFGGSTTINSGTCLRTPNEVLRRWRFDDGLVEFDPAAMEPYFRKVEAMLEVAVATRETLGNSAHVIARGAESLGWSHGPLTRNAPGCDGEGTCCFGCPTDAKRSTNVSYLPSALRAGAMAYHHARVEEILVAGGRAVGVLARAVGTDGGEAARIRVLARTVVLSCGAIGTPTLLLRQGLANRSGQVGRNLTVHPAANAWALCDERIEGWKGIPQSYGVDEFVREGIRFEGAFVPLDVAAPTAPQVGREWTEFVDRFDHIAAFGFMIEETSRGRVVLTPSRKPQLLYRLNDGDRRKILRGHALLARMFLAGGARWVATGVHGHPLLRNEDDVARFEREAPEHIPARRLELAAFHPLGTCRMGADPARSVVSSTHETHDVPGLFIVDGSCVNGPLGVNPQVTIMALAERASTFVERAVEASGLRGAARRGDSNANTPAAPELEFTETMAGTCTRLADGQTVPTSFTVRAAAADASSCFAGLRSDRGGTLSLDGTATLPGIAEAARCTGSLVIHPGRRRGTLVYDLDFTGADGVAYHLHGEKSVPWWNPLRGMTTLVTEVTRAHDDSPVARGTLRFALGDIVPWLKTWRLRRAV
jgi:choline dehydrogenase-like flavoprotein